MAESPIRAREPIADADAAELLQTGELRVLGRLPWSSNATFLVDVSPGADPGAEPDQSQWRTDIFFPACESDGT